MNARGVIGRPAVALLLAVSRFAAVLLVGLASTDLVSCGRTPAATGSAPASSEICQAVKSGDLEKVKTLLKEHPDLVFSKGLNDWTLLHWAAFCGHKDMAELLLSNKAEVNAKDGFDNTPLHAAAWGGYKDVAELLLANKADVNARNSEGRMPLHYAAIHGHKDVVELLLTNRADVNARNNNGWTPLHFAKTKEIAEMLIAHGADVNARNKKGQTPLHYAAMGGYKGVAELLRQHGGRDFFGELHDAVRNGELEKVKGLLKDHPDVVLTEDEGGTTPLHWAAKKGDKDLVELLLANKADVNARTNAGDTPLHCAASNGHKDVVEFLLANKADVNATNNRRWTPWDTAVIAGHIEVAEFLHQHDGLK